MTALPPVPEEVFGVVASDPSGPHFAVRDALRSANARTAESLNCYLAALPRETVAVTLEDPQFRWFASRTDDVDREARIWLTERALTAEIPRRRHALLRSQIKSRRPTPYDIPALADIRVDSDHLVRLSDFEFDGSRLCRNGYAFTALCTAGSPNSTYWLLQVLYEAKVADRTSIRLDPFLCGSEESFPAMFYKMWIYGQSIDWNRIGDLRAPDHGRWQPGPLSHRSKFTDFVWTPRRSEVNFIAEEVPELEDALTHAARYIHAVYQRSTKVISHLDGALRFYMHDELRDRHGIHVRNAGKAGFREKVFRTDAPISRDTLSAIVQAFYVWNQDVTDYFTRRRQASRAAIAAPTKQSSGPRARGARRVAADRDVM